MSLSLEKKEKELEIIKEKILKLKERNLILERERGAVFNTEANIRLDTTSANHTHFPASEPMSRILQTDYGDSDSDEEDDKDSLDSYYSY